MAKEVIGIAGCGAMGEPMAQRLLTAGFEVWVHDVRPLAEFGAIAEYMLEDAAEFARRCNVVISAVRDADQTRSLLFSEAQGIVRGASPPEILVISSTVSPRFIRQLLTELPTQTSLVDAAMSGAPYRAREGTLSFMLGGSDADVDRLMPILQVMGNRIFRLGDVAMGMTTKVLNNYCAASSIAATHRVLGMAQVLGLDRRSLLEVMKHSSGSNWFADNIDQIDWSDEGYSLDNTIGIVEKDVLASLDTVSESPDIDRWPLDDGLLDALRRLEPLELESATR